MQWNEDEHLFVLKCWMETSGVNVPSQVKINKEGLTYPEWFRASVLGITVRYESMHHEAAHVTLSQQLWYLGQDPTEWVTFNKELFSL